MQAAPVSEANTAPKDRTGHGFYHDGRFATLMDIMNHYTVALKLPLSDAEKRDVVEYLKSL